MAWPPVPAATAPRRAPIPITDATWYTARGVSRFARSTGRDDSTGRFDPFPGHELSTLQGVDRSHGPGRWYETSAAWKRHVMSPVMRGDNPRIRAARAAADARFGPRAVTKRQSLQVRVDFCSTHPSPRSHRFGPSQWMDGQRSQRFGAAAFTDPPERFAYTAKLFETPPSPVFDKRRAAVTPRRERMVPNFHRTTGRANHRMPWQPQLFRDDPGDAGAGDTSPPASSPASRRRRRRRDDGGGGGRDGGGDDAESGGDDDDDDGWVAQYIPAVLKARGRTPAGSAARGEQRLRAHVTRERRRLRAGRRRSRVARSADLQSVVGRDVVPTFMREATPAILASLVTDYTVVQGLTKRRAAALAVARRPFDRDAAAADLADPVKAQGLPGRPPLNAASGVAMGSDARKGLCDVDGITRAWARRHRAALLAAEADAAAQPGAIPPPFSVRELLQPGFRGVGDAGAPLRTEGLGTPDLSLGCGRGDDVRAMVGHPTPKAIRRVRREIES